MKGVLRCVAASALLAVAAAPLPAQGWRLEARGGEYRLEGAPVGSASGGGALGLAYLGTAGSFGLYGGLPVGEESAPWGAAATALRLTRGEGPVRLGVHLSGQAFLQGDPGEDGGEGPLLDDLPFGPGGPFDGGEGPSRAGWGASAEVTPLLSVGHSPVRLEARAGGAVYHSEFRDRAFRRRVGMAHLRVSTTPSRAVYLAFDGTAYRAEEGTYPYVGVTAVLARGQFGARGTFGTWLDETIETVPWSLATSLEVLDRLSLEASVRRDAADPLFLTPAGTSWSVGASIRLSRPSRPAAPVPAAYENGEATIVLPARDAGEAPRVAGDFNDWTAEPMVREGDRWTFRVRLETGVYYYAFVTPDGDWFVPESVPGRKTDGFGGYTAVLVVE